MEKNKSQTPWFILARTPDLNIYEQSVLSFMCSLPKKYTPKRSWVEKMMRNKMGEKKFKDTWSSLKTKKLIKLKNNKNILSGFEVDLVKVLAMQDLQFKGGLNVTGVKCNRGQIKQGLNVTGGKCADHTPPISNPPYKEQDININNIPANELAGTDKKLPQVNAVKNYGDAIYSKQEQHKPLQEPQKQPALASLTQSNTKASVVPKKADKALILKDVNYLTLADGWLVHMMNFKRKKPATWTQENIAHELEKISRLEQLTYNQQRAILVFIKADPFWGKLPLSVFSIRRANRESGISKLDQIINAIKKQRGAQPTEQPKRAFMGRERFSTREEAEAFYAENKHFDKPKDMGGYWELTHWKMI